MLNFEVILKSLKGPDDNGFKFRMRGLRVRITALFHPKQQASGSLHSNIAKVVDIPDHISFPRVEKSISGIGGTFDRWIQKQHLHI